MPASTWWWNSDTAAAGLTAAVANSSPVEDMEDLDGSAGGHGPSPAHGTAAGRTGNRSDRWCHCAGRSRWPPGLDVADAIVDLVSSGSTMRVNGLRPLGTLLESQAVLVAPPSAGGSASADWPPCCERGGGRADPPVPDDECSRRCGGAHLGADPRAAGAQRHPAGPQRRCGVALGGRRRRPVGMSCPASKRPGPPESWCCRWSRWSA